MNEDIRKELKKFVKVFLDIKMKFDTLTKDELYLASSVLFRTGSNLVVLDEGFDPCRILSSDDECVGIEYDALILYPEDEIKAFIKKVLPWEHAVDALFMDAYSSLVKKIKNA